MGKRLELTGQRFGRLVVLGDAPSHKLPSGQLRRRVVCRCDCGKRTLSAPSKLKAGFTLSCGCYSHEQIAIRSSTHGMASRAGRSPEHKTWSHLKARCLNPSDKEWHNYGGRGIKVCDRWLHSFEAFYEDMGAKPSAKHSIDRISVNGDYEPGNCRWATQAEQQRNRRNNKFVEYQGELMTQTDASRLSGIHLMTIRYRIARGLTGDALFAKPTTGKRRSG